VLHGYSSATTVHEVAEETAGMAAPLVAFYIGDHDPSGMHMSDVDLPARLAEYGARVNLVRLALRFDQIVRHRLPSFDVDTKRQDPRYRWYVAQHGERTGGKCWELDAFSPVDLRETVEHAILARIDRPGWNRYEATEALEHASLVDVLSRWKAAPVAHV
jgi:hypothetical protein